MQFLDGESGQRGEPDHRNARQYDEPGQRACRGRTECHSRRGRDGEQRSGALQAEGNLCQRPAHQVDLSGRDRPKAQAESKRKSLV